MNGAAHTNDEPDPQGIEGDPDRINIGINPPFVFHARSR